ncbi:hypothetical protein HUE46_04260 [Flavobacterium columnare]|uniref:hypothetical protein n=2 Tax=Flavobacterium columnare TaxID=996 RepID=UPI0007F9EAB7|nr:hypothetical protein [Flavobacterium columnare]ANO47587.1 hypothetical protein Pf1_02132 [Flavobacterium columnare]APT21784.1 hypothetical protein BU993_03500 [Flavobacterium columnare]QOG89290.1 hypothetical protein HUE41_04260 [Flavobacterium columnare]QOG91949.1 hypothetical protein HUE42_04255 [Flavobacterium columnare]QOG94613.1 hypothetical protein HUE43_04260 [Flavobacterium columnare]
MKKVILVLLINLLLSCSNDKDLVNLNTNQPTDVAAQDPTENDIKQYFDFPVTSIKKADEIVNSITNTRGLKKVGYKQVDLLVENTIIEKKDAVKGEVIAKISGKFANKSFSKSYTFFCSSDGPNDNSEDSHIAKNIKMEWKPEFKNNPEELTDLDFDALYRLKKTDLFTIEYLSKWFDFYSKKPNSDKAYKFTSEDLKNIKITEIKNSEIVDRFVSVILEYKNKHSFNLAFEFDKEKYYKKKIVLNKDEIRKYYVSGVHENLEQFKETLFRIPNDFVLVINTKYSVDYDNNLIRCAVSLLGKGKGNEKLVYLVNYQISGFKPLSDFPKEFIVQRTDGLDRYMQDILKDIPDGDVKAIVSPLRNKIKKELQYGMIREDNIINTLGDNFIIRLSNGQLALKLKEKTNNPDSFDTLIPLSQDIAHKDIHFRPDFTIASAVKKQGKLILELNFIVHGYPTIDKFKREIVVNL